MLKKLVFLCLMYSQFSIAEGLPSENLKQVGEARMSHLFWDIYDAKLFTQSGTYQAEPYPAEQYPVLLSLTYLRDVEAEHIVKATNEQWQHLGYSQFVGQYDEQLLKIWPDIKRGESLSVFVGADEKAVFYHNQRVIGGIDNPAFASHFLAIWLSPNTSEPKMRQQLINSAAN